MYSQDKRVVMTLDAGGTNFVFSAIRGYEEIVPPVSYPSHADRLDECLAVLSEGFKGVLGHLRQLGIEPAAISFAFPGPADYTRGIIDNNNNLRAFEGGVPLGDFLRLQFGLPVFINNDADLFAYGECIAGALPETNARLEAIGCPRRFRNLTGFTFGTGFGCGITCKGELYVGDNSCAGEMIGLRHKLMPDIFIEDGVSIRAVQRVYHEHCEDARDLSPKDIRLIADGELEGNREAALKSLEEFGEIAGDGIASAMTLLDGLIVLGGGLCGNRRYFLPALMGQLNGRLNTLSGQQRSRMMTRVYCLDDEQGLKDFAGNTLKKIKVPGSDLTLDYDPVKKIGLVFSKLGTSKATSIGAYAYALHELDK